MKTVTCEEETGKNIGRTPPQITSCCSWRALGLVSSTIKCYASNVGLKFHTFQMDHSMPAVLVPIWAGWLINCPLTSLGEHLNASFSSRLTCLLLRHGGRL